MFAAERYTYPARDMSGPRQFSGYGSSANPSFSRRQQYNTSNSKYGSHYNDKKSASYLQDLWERSPSRQKQLNSHSTSSAYRFGNTGGAKGRDKTRTNSQVPIPPSAKSKTTTSTASGGGVHHPTSAAAVKGTGGQPSGTKTTGPVHESSYSKSQTPTTTITTTNHKAAGHQSTTNTKPATTLKPTATNSYSFNSTAPVHESSYSKSKTPTTTTTTNHKAAGHQSTTNTTPTTTLKPNATSSYSYNTTAPDQYSKPAPTAKGPVVSATTASSIPMFYHHHRYPGDGSGLDSTGDHSVSSNNNPDVNLSNKKQDSQSVPVSLANPAATSKPAYGGYSPIKDQSIPNKKQGTESTALSKPTNTAATTPSKPAIPIGGLQHHITGSAGLGSATDSPGHHYSEYSRHKSIPITYGTSESSLPSVKGLPNVGNTCFYNSVMQNLTVLVILYKELERIVKSPEPRHYTLDGGGKFDSDTVTVHKSSTPGPLTSKLYSFLTSYNNTRHPDPEALLNGIGCKNTRFRGRSQQDSHELFRTLLDGLRTEEAESVKKAIDMKFDSVYDEKAKLMKRVYKRKIVTHIDEVFGGEQSSLIICRRCKHISQTNEPFLDLSLPIVDSRMGSARNMRSDKNQDERTTTFQGVCKLLKQKGDPKVTAYPLYHERSHDGRCTVENCLNEYANLEVMDDDNMFICAECNRRAQEQAPLSQMQGKGAEHSGGCEYSYQRSQAPVKVLPDNNSPTLSPVSKLLLISKLPPVLVLHLKRFSIGYTVTKKNTHVSFPYNLDMAKYCSKNCPGSFHYKLKGVVSHSGSLHCGHYIAYVNSNNCWYYAGDSHVNKVSLDTVLSCQAYMLFYEKT